MQLALEMTITMEATETAPMISKRLADMAPTARIWVYKSVRNLSNAEQKLVREQGGSFTSTWAAHGAPLDATVEVLYDRFVVISVDEEQAKASGTTSRQSRGSYGKCAPKRKARGYMQDLASGIVMAKCIAGPE